MKEPTRIKNYRLAKENHDGELPWVRVEDFAKLRLKRPIILVNGCFDVLHAGHWKTIFHARKHGKTVVIALDSDRLVSQNKPDRPILTWVERATALGYTPADYLVEIDSDEEFVRLVKLLKPDLRVKGAEYREQPSRIPDVPCLFIHDSGMRTSEIIRRIKDGSNRPNRGNS